MTVTETQQTLSTEPLGGKAFCSFTETPPQFPLLYLGTRVQDQSLSTACWFYSSPGFSLLYTSSSDGILWGETSIHNTMSNPHSHTHEDDSSEGSVICTSRYQEFWSHTYIWGNSTGYLKRAAWHQIHHTEKTYNIIALMICVIYSPAFTRSRQCWKSLKKILHFKIGSAAEFIKAEMWQFDHNPINMIINCLNMIPFYNGRDRSLSQLLISLPDSCLFSPSLSPSTEQV